MFGPFYAPILKMLSHSRPGIGHTFAVVSLFISVIESRGFAKLYSLEI
jgi:hypothetical protein